ncbi:MBL fold metallo-hydrolase [Streptomyces sp. KL116D]|uniref:MBL fold metallo-hydrolase n=1 Tax=Streptomyces sp. KL116D TaxID=3045152 RepID=UPI0035565539
MCVVGQGRWTDRHRPRDVHPDAKEVVAAADAVLITHDHFDHFDEELIAHALDARPGLRVYGPASVVGRWAARRGQVTAVTASDRFEVAGFDIVVSGELHAPIHRDIPRVANVGCLVDAPLPPRRRLRRTSAPVDTLLLPTSGPWTQLGRAADYVHARSCAQPPGPDPTRSRSAARDSESVARFLSAALTDVPLTISSRRATPSLYEPRGAAGRAPLLFRCAAERCRPGS